MNSLSSAIPTGAAQCLTFEPPRIGWLLTSTNGCVFLYRSSDAGNKWLTVKIPQSSNFSATTAVAGPVFSHADRVGALLVQYQTQDNDQRLTWGIVR